MATLHGAQQSGWEAGTASQISHAFHAFYRGNGHNAGDDGHGDTGEQAALAKIVKITIVEKELRADVVGTFIDFGLEIIHFQQSIRGSGMSFREACDTDTEPSFVRMQAPLVELANVAYQIGSLRKGILRTIVVRLIRGRITS